MEEENIAIEPEAPPPEEADPPFEGLRTAPAPHVPPGAPVRTEPDLSAMSAADKIRYALGRS